MDDRTAFFHTLVPTPGCPVKTSSSSLAARERVNAITSAAVPPSRYPQLVIYVKTHVVARRNARGGRGAQEHLVAALRRLPVREQA